MGRYGMDIGDEVYILYEDGKDPRKLSIADLKRMIENGEYKGILGDMQKTRVIRLGNHLKLEEKENLASYIVQRRVPKEKAEILLSLTGDKVKKLVNSMH